MTTYQQSVENEFLTHDFYVQRKWLFLIEGFGLTTGKLYLCYVILMYCFCLFFLCMSIYAIYLVAPNKELIINALHVVLNTIFAIVALTISRTTHMSIGQTREMIHKGFYQYENEEPDERIRELRKSTIEEVRKRANQFIYIFACGTLILLLFFPVSQYLLVSDEDYDAIVDISNPYLPQFMYLPFSTRSAIGFTVAFILNAALLLYTYGTAITLNDVYVSCIVQLRIQLEILNHSIRTIQKRAYLMYRQNNNRRHEDFQESLFENSEYQRCLYACLRSNIQHHQLLKKFHAAGLPFNGSCLLLVAMLASFIFASQIYLVMKGPPINLLITFVLTFFTEQTYSFFICYFGETVLEESSKLFESLYSISWMNCNKSFNKILNIFMVYTRKPIRVKTIVLDVTASLETWADFLSAMYKIMNLFRQSDP